MPVSRNSRGGRCVLRSTATETFTLASLAVGDEDVQGAAIVGVYWTGEWTVSRAGAEVLVLSDGQDNWDLVGWGGLFENADGNIDVKAGSVAGTILLHVTKYSDGEPFTPIPVVVTEP